MNKIKKLSPFYWVYFGFIAAFLIALFICLGVFRSYLADYESAQPIHVAESVMEKYFSGDSLSALIDEFAPEMTASEKADLEAYYKEKYTGEFIFNSTSLGDGDHNYAVTSNGKRIASFSLKESGETSKNGFPIYVLDTFTLKIPSSHTYVIEAPSDYAVTFRGGPVGTDSITETDIETESGKHMYGDVSGITYTRYSLKSFFSEGEIRAVTPKGTTVDFTLENGVYSTPICYDIPMSDELKSYVVRAIEDYAIYVQNDSWFGAIEKYFDPASDLYESIKIVDTWTVIDHDSWTFADQIISEYYEYGGDIISCRIAMTHILHKSGMDDYKDYIDMTVYLRKVDGKYLIYDTMKH